MRRLCLAYPREQADSKLFKPALQSGDVSIRLCNSDHINRPQATGSEWAQQKTRPWLRERDIER